MKRRTLLITGLALLVSIVTAFTAGRATAQPNATIPRSWGSVKAIVASNGMLVLEDSSGTIRYVKPSGELVFTIARR